MPAILTSSSGPEKLIRPLCYVPEEELIELSEQLAFPIVPCKLCGSLDAKRKEIKNLLTKMSEANPHIKGNVLASLKNVVPSHLLAKDIHGEPEPKEPSAFLPIVEHRVH